MNVRPGSRSVVAAATVLLWGAALASPAAAVKHTGREYNTLYAGLGAKGYDVVSYFADNKPVEGSADYTHSYGGVTWRFASKEHRDLFAKTPAKYAPQYGGFCSWGVSEGKLFDVDPVNGWTVHGDKLYLNFNQDLNKKFAEDPDGFITKANHNWPMLDR
jgi:YHS domain-containing protein